MSFIYYSNDKFIMAGLVKNNIIGDVSNTILSDTLLAICGITGYTKNDIKYYKFAGYDNEIRGMLKIII